MSTANDRSMARLRWWITTGPPLVSHLATTGIMAISDHSPGMFHPVLYRHWTLSSETTHHTCNRSFDRVPHCDGHSHRPRSNRPCHPGPQRWHPRCKNNGCRNNVAHSSRLSPFVIGHHVIGPRLAVQRRGAGQFGLVQAEAATDLVGIYLAQGLVRRAAAARLIRIAVLGVVDLNGRSWVIRCGHERSPSVGFTRSTLPGGK